MMKKSRILALILALVMIFSACAKQSNYKEPSAEKTLANSFLIDKEGKVIDEKDIGKRKVIQIYFDPMCSSCIVTEEIVAEKLGEILEDNAVIRYNPVAFLGDDGNNISYSQRIASMLLSVMELEKDKSFEFLKSVMNLNFVEGVVKDIETEISKDENKYIKDQKLTEEFYKIQDNKIFTHLEKVYTGNDFNKVKENAEKKIGLVKDLTQAFLENDNLKAMSKDGKSLYTPFIVVEGNDKALDSTLETLVEDLKGVLKEDK